MFSAEWLFVLDEILPFLSPLPSVVLLEVWEIVKIAIGVFFARFTIVPLLKLWWHLADRRR